MKKLLLIALVAGGFTFAAALRSEAQVYFNIGFGFPGYYGYYPYGCNTGTDNNNVSQNPRPSIDPAAYFPDFGEAAGLVTGLLAG